MTDLITDDRNANRGTSRGQRLLGESLKAYGAGRSVLTDRAGRVIAGNKTVEQATALGLPIQIVRSDGRTLIVINHTTPGEGVYDPFVGSGTTLIAAEKTDRVAYVMDLDPPYVQVALTRWEQFTGHRAKRIGRAMARRRS